MVASWRDVKESLHLLGDSYWTGAVGGFWQPDLGELPTEPPLSR